MENLTENDKFNFITTFAEVKVLKERIEGHEKRAEEREERRKERDLILLERMDRFLKKMEDMTERCFNKEADYTLFKQHLSDTEKSKNIWQDRNFRILLGVTGGAWTLMIIVLKWLMH